MRLRKAAVAASFDLYIQTNQMGVEDRSDGPAFSFFLIVDVTHFNNQSHTCEINPRPLMNEAQSDGAGLRNVDRSGVPHIKGQR